MAPKFVKKIYLVIVDDMPKAYVDGVYRYLEDAEQRRDDINKQCGDVIAFVQPETIYQ